MSDDLQMSESLREKLRALLRDRRRDYEREFIEASEAYANARLDGVKLAAFERRFLNAFKALGRSRRAEKERAA